MTRQVQVTLHRLPDELTRSVPVIESERSLSQDRLRAYALEAISASEKVNLHRLDLKGIDGRGLHFYGLDLSGSSFDKAQLQGAVFDECTLDNCSFDQAEMATIKFVRCSLIEASFHDADIQKAEMRSVTLQRANIEQCELSGAVIIGSNLDGANFWNTSLSDATIEKSVLDNANIGGSTNSHDYDYAIFEKHTASGKRGLHIEGLKLSGNSATYLGFENCIIDAGVLRSEEDGDFSQAQFRNVVFGSGTELQGDFSEAVFDDSYVGDARLVDVNLASAKLDSTVFEGSRFERVDFTDAQGRDWHVKGASFERTVWPADTGAEFDGCERPTGDDEPKADPAIERQLARMQELSGQFRAAGPSPERALDSIPQPTPKPADPAPAKSKDEAPPFYPTFDL